MSLTVVFVLAAGCAGSDADGPEPVGDESGAAGATRDAGKGTRMPGMTVMDTPGPNAADGDGSSKPGASSAGNSTKSDAGLSRADAGRDAGESSHGDPDEPPVDAAVGVAGDGGFPVGEDECGPIPTMLPKEGAMARRVSGSGMIEYDVQPPNEFTSLRTTLLVPAEPPPNGVIFLWPGLQPLPSGANYQPVGNGVLQPVLTWGASCAPGAPSTHSDWWISPLYVNISARDRTFQGCKGGQVLTTDTGSLLQLDMYYDAPKWVQKVVDLKTNKSSEYGIDLMKQQQGRAFFVIELQTSAKPTEDVVFTKSVLTMAKSDPSACEPVTRGMTDYASKARVSADGKHCCIDRIVVRAAGVKATTVDP